MSYPVHEAIRLLREASETIGRLVEPCAPQEVAGELALSRRCWQTAHEVELLVARQRDAEREVAAAKADEAAACGERPAQRLRWVVRGGERVLQQGYAVGVIFADGGRREWLQWRDVPTVEAQSQTPV